LTQKDSESLGLPRYAYLCHAFPCKLATLLISWVTILAGTGLIALGRKIRISLSNPNGTLLVLWPTADSYLYPGQGTPHGYIGMVRPYLSIVIGMFKPWPCVWTDSMDHQGRQSSRTHPADHEPVVNGIVCESSPCSRCSRYAYKAVSIHFPDRFFA